MSLNREMLQVARLSPRVLGDAVPLVAAYLRSLINEDGGVANRDGVSDIYYTTFGVSGLIALREPVEWARLSRYLLRFGDGQDLDLVHHSCLARLWSLVPVGERPPVCIESMLDSVEALRTEDGGYNAIPDADRGTLYGCFLALGAYQDLGVPLPEPWRMLECIDRLKTADGGYANSTDLPVGLTPTSSAAATLMRQLGVTPDPELSQWLLQRFHPHGGFRATPDAPLPDLLSTATALHALTSLHVDYEPLRETCLDFVDTLWTARGGFYGTWEDEQLDCEYTYYGLLALGHLSS